MSREEAIEILKAHHMWTGEPQEIIDVRKENKALEMAIQALSQEPCEECKYKTFTELYFHTDPEMVEQEPCDDLISREAAIISINKLYEECEEWRALNDLQYGTNRGLSLAIEVIEELPSVTLQHKFNADEKHVENTLDAVSRKAVINAIDKWISEYKPQHYLIQSIRDLPSVTQKSETVTEFADRCRECGARYGKLLKQKTGHWIYDETIENWRCSKCNETPKTMGYVGTADFMAEHFRFCNHCGAKMVEPQESEDKE